MSDSEELENSRQELSMTMVKALHRRWSESMQERNRLATRIVELEKELKEAKGNK